jgi:hypothetical protein
MIRKSILSLALMVSVLFSASIILADNSPPVTAFEKVTISKIPAPAVIPVMFRSQRIEAGVARQQRQSIQEMAYGNALLPGYRHTLIVLRL